MRLSKVRIRNFRCIRDISVDFDDTMVLRDAAAHFGPRGRFRRNFLSDSSIPESRRPVAIQTFEEKWLCWSRNRRRAPRLLRRNYPGTINAYHNVFRQLFRLAKETIEVSV